MRHQYLRPDYATIPAKGAITLKQTGSVKDIQRDMTRYARLPGKRVSRSGKSYWETRRNRSDSLGKNI